MANKEPHFTKVLAEVSLSLIGLISLHLGHGAHLLQEWE